jgi:anaerobic magnesium-protoporphyrin IX monomethyl ester cyclase
MRIALVGPEIEENLALRYLAAALDRAGHAVRIVAFNRNLEASRVAKAVLAGDPGLVGFSLVAQRRYEDFGRLAHSLRSRGYRGHLTAGGHFAGLRAAEILADTPALDTILHHDGEERIVALAEWLESAGDTRPAGGDLGPTGDAPFAAFPDPPAELDGISWRAGGGELRHRPPTRVVDIDGIAAPLRRRCDRTLGYPRAPIVSSRGCSGSCSFCSIHAWHRQVPTGRLRFRAPALVAGEMIALHRDQGVRVFVFHDDDFIHPDRVEALRRCRAILEEAERGIGAPIAFVLKCRPDDVEEGLFAYLKSKGLVRAYVGIESHSRAGIRTLNRRVTPEQNDRALFTLRGLGVYSCFNLLLFHPETTLAELEENLQFLERSVMHPFDIARAELYARSSLEDRMVREGRALGDYRGFDYRIADRQAEALFRLFSDALWERHFGSRSILHRSQELGFRASVLRRMHPELVSADRLAKVDALIREVNLDTVHFMRRLVGEVVQAGPHWSLVRRRAVALEVRREAEERRRRQNWLWTSLSLELEGRALLGRLFDERARATDSPAHDAAARVWIRKLGRTAAAVPFAAAALGLLSCDADQTQVCDPPPPPVRFATQIEPYLDETCALPECHATETAAAGLILERGTAYENLVNHPSTQVPGLARVRPGQVDRSYLVHKLDGTQAAVGGSGERMPKGGRVDPRFLDRLKQWIRDGAPRD